MITAAILFVLFSAAGAGAEELSAKEIMTIVDDRPDGDDRRSVMTMTLIKQTRAQARSWSKKFFKGFREGHKVRHGI